MTEADPQQQTCYTLYGAECSYFSGKARAYLRFRGVPFQEVTATREVYRSVILPRVGYPIIPVVVTPDGATLQDTSEIIDAIEVREPGSSVYPATPRQRVVAGLLEVYGDEWLLIPAMHYRWNYNEGFALEEFGRTTRPELPPEQHREAGEQVAGPFRGALPYLGINEATIPAIEASYEAFLGELDAHLAQHDYLLGTRPSIGDFGLIGPLYAHQYRDPRSGEHMRQRAPHVVAWVERMIEPPTPNAGAFLPDDHVPETLLPVLARMFREQLPVLQDTADLLTTWAEENAGAPIPRAIGAVSFRLGDVEATRMAFPFNLWMLQRPLDAYRGLDDTDRAAVDALLARAGGDLSSFRPGPRLDRERFRLVLADRR